MAQITGTTESELLEGTEDDDTIRGLAGDDTIQGGGGADWLVGGPGDDLIAGGDGQLHAYGGDGNDTLRGARGDQTLEGGAGNDELMLGVDDQWWDAGPPQSRAAYGGTGDDILSTIGPNDATLSGGSGTDTARISLLTALGQTTQVVLTGPGAGLSSSTGQTMVMTGLDRLEFYADFGNETVTGGDLGDIIYVGGATDRVDAGGGDDTVGYRLGAADTLDGGDGHDLLVVEGQQHASVYFIVQSDGTVDDGQLSEISGFERYHVMSQGRADDIISTGSGQDTIEAAGGNDTVFGGTGRDRLRGESGNDTLYGGGSSDRISGGSGNDLLYGGGGNDKLAGGAGFDTLIGGNGADVFILTHPDESTDHIRDFETGIDTLRLQGTHFAVDGSLGTGPLDASRLSIGAASGSHGQFVLRHDVGLDRSELIWDGNGDNPAGGVVAVATFTGEVTLIASDIWIV